MEAKKTPTKDVHRLSRLYTSLGFLVSLAMVSTAFEWKFYTDPVVDLRGVDFHSDTEILDIPVTDLTPPKPAAQLVNIVVKKPEEAETLNIGIIDLDIETIPEIFIPPVVEPEDGPDLPMIIVEESAQPHGGMEAFYSFVARQLGGKYPAMARRMGVQGYVFVEFVVERSGKLTDVHVVKGIGAGCDELAIKAVEAAPLWQPGKQRGKSVRQRLTLPILFKLD